MSKDGSGHRRSGKPSASSKPSPVTGSYKSTVDPTIPYPPFAPRSPYAGRTMNIVPSRGAAWLGSL